MKILHTENSLGWGGQEIRILTEAAGMIRRGHEVQLIAPPESHIFKQAPAHGVPVTALPIAKKRLPGLLALRRWLKANPVDVINTHSSTDSWLAALACATLGGNRGGASAAPAIVRTRHVSAPVSTNAATRWLYTRAAHTIVTTGESLKQQLVRDNGFAAEHIVSITTGIDLTRFTPAASAAQQAATRTRLKLPRDKHIIGIAATLRSWKGHRFLIEAFATLKRDDIHLLIVGDGPQREALEQLIGQLGVGARVTLAGNQTNVVPWLQSMDVFALPSYANEGVPQAILQAFACGLPVVTTAAGAIAEVALDNETGLIVPMQDAAGLAQGLARLLDVAALRARLGRAALAQAHARHGIDIMLDRMEAVFLRAAGKLN